MLNGFWKAAYDLSMMAPVLVIVPLFEHECGLLGYFMIAAGLILIAIGVLLPSISRRYLTKEPIIIDSVHPNDSFYEYVFSYTLPIIPLLTGSDLSVSFGVICIISILVVMSNRSVPNPFLRLAGYHFYTVDLKDGFKGYTLINKGRLGSKSELVRGYFAAQFMIISGDEDESGNDVVDRCDEEAEDDDEDY